MSRLNRRGPYAKGIERRREILDTALEVFADRGLDKLSLRAIADDLDINHGTILHYFPSLEDLLLELLVRHDSEVDLRSRDDGGVGLVGELQAGTESNVRIPSLVALYTSMLGRSVEPGNSRARAYFAERFEVGRQQMGRAIKEAQLAAGTDGSDAELVAGVVMAALDGLQVQWLLDPDFDFVGAIRKLQPLIGNAPEVWRAFQTTTFWGTAVPLARERADHKTQ
ncbi:TetR/AcrR family transcriptional regulator [Microbacterium sp. cx-55]|uniref:TetR/AcrR family transcriptional regulator n=1 Tax=unclassified Microbacterium TaxID=2609290 RepID=UPI001CBF6AB4|nr:MULTISPECIES: TetR/AcrR family transcriptional regulator [unclassified Microbacterium]MBZ4486759.1 TetR/AcrR family transcriptional regulator [Microbacterium sp. cx-55]MCC4907736.1 TetR/AcrR family transcriptional regulator [Microbacterium sp. cx-59]UGB36284.1 TetR/AcrR family transcriptional regulator [Microbacterium sp. cx-55]